MTHIEIANEFVKRYRSDNPFSKYELYDEDCISIENPKNGEKSIIKGLDEIKTKGAEFYKQFDTVTKREISDPVIIENGFNVNFKIEGVKNNQPFIITELAIYSVMNGKIITEEFIY